MGTSTSYRAPRTPRWQAFVAALDAGMPIERVRSELFNAGSEWQEAFASPPIAVLAETIVQSYSEVASESAEGGLGADIVRSALSDALDAALTAGASAALPFAERAYSIVLLEAAAGERETSAEPTQGVTQRFLGELLAQFARHTVAREAGRLVVGKGDRISIAETKARGRDLAAAAARAASGVDAPDDPRAVRSQWSELVSRAFTEARRLEGQG